MKVKTNIAIIGAGVVGLNVAFELLKRGHKDILIIEKNPRIMSETSSHNSGVIHGGFDAKPGSLKAKFNVEGRHLFEKEFFNNKVKPDFEFAQIPSIILAYNENDENELKKLYKQAIENGLKKEEVDFLTTEQILKLNPNINPKVTKGFLCRTSWAIDPLQFGIYISKEAKKLGLKELTNFEVSSISSEKNNTFKIKTKNKGEVTANFIINAAGVWVEEIAKLVEKEPEFSINTRRGQYRILNNSEISKVGSYIWFLTPSKHGKGVVIAPLFDGTVLVGPNAENGVPLKDIQLVTEEGLNFVKDIGRKIIPKINLNRVERVMAGSRAINTNTNDYHISMSKEVPNFLHVAGTQSPALSGVLSISRYVSDIYEKNKK